MPYIPLAERFRASTHPQTSGELNYAITALLVKYMNGAFDAPSYQAINDCIGALEGAKLEFYRRVAIPYEETKRKSAGDVY